MSYITRRPSSRLSGVVERLWRVDAPPTGTPETICPDGCSEIVIHLGDPMRDQPRNLLVGPMDVPITVTPLGRVTMLGARLTPDGLHRLLPISQERLLQRVIALDDVWSAWTRRTLDQVASVTAASQQLNVFEAALESLLPESFADRRGDGVRLMLRAMRARGGPIDVERVAGIAGVSRRQLERRFRERVGLPPHLFGRIVRFQHAFAALGEEPGAALAARLGFVDQAHLVHEVRRFSGRTPTLLANAEGLTTFFVNDSRD